MHFADEPEITSQKVDSGTAPGYDIMTTAPSASVQTSHPQANTFRLMDQPAKTAGANESASMNKGYRKKRKGARHRKRKPTQAISNGKPPMANLTADPDPIQTSNDGC